eukprot:CAMPEP_0168323250 /NCGR_PEP_ID=MMETSP0213-20121227/3374_1 /TAXON_ID=151035 /ORGANISM="Euplotes harpa, Strain FSP1.4" /LENGTH=183 /DNA_ID=CAMNT_0008325295 /DNA_START=113 /DNA_END=664 /DNA_ORIENTATION=+
MDEEMDRDPNVFLMGEEVAKYHGAYKVSKDLYEKHTERRVVDTPITEAGFTGLGVGAALYGLRPIIECYQLRSENQVHVRWRCALSDCVQRTQWVERRSCCAALPVLRRLVLPLPCPGLKVLAPYSAEDARGLLKAAIRDDNPVIFLEHELMYGKSFDVSDEAQGKDFLIEIGKAKVEVAGTD